MVGSIVMCTSVCLCLSVCPWGYLPNHMRDLYHIFVHVAYGRGSVLLRLGDEILRGGGNFEGLLPNWQCIVQHSIWDTYKNGWTDRDAVWEDEWAWPEEQCGGDDHQKEGAVLEENICLTSLIPLIIVNWTATCSSTRQGQTLCCKRWTSIISRELRVYFRFSGWHHVFSTVGSIAVWISRRTTDFA